MASSYRDRLLRQLALEAAASPLSLFLAALAALLLASPDAWGLGLATLAGEAALLWRRVRDPERARRSGEELLRRRWRETLNRLEGISSAVDAQTAATLAAILESQERLLGLEGEARHLLPHSRMELTSLLEHCLSLAEKRSRLQNYLAGFRSQEIQRQAVQIERQVEQSGDALTRQLYAGALEQKRQELDNYTRLEGALQRIDGQLAAVRCTCDNLLSRVLCLQAAETRPAEPEADPLFNELNQLTVRVATLEASLSETLLRRGPA